MELLALSDSCYFNQVKYWKNGKICKRFIWDLCLKFAYTTVYVN